MASGTHRAAAPAGLGLGARAGFTLLPLLAFAALLGVLSTRTLPLSGSVPWVPALDIAFAWRIDGLSVLLLVLITGIGSAVFVYAGSYLAGHPHQRRLYVLLTLFMLAMIGCVTADDLFVLFVFWELTSLLSFLLIGFEHEDPASRASASQALLLTGGGGLALLAGFILLARAAGTSSIWLLIERAPDLPITPSLAAGVALVVVGCFTKSAQFPFHFWLPNAMSAPTPVSAYLHSATMVKLGVYLLARLDPAFGGWLAWQEVLVGAGTLTSVLAAVLALRERDLKRILAWSTVGGLGTLVMLVGLRAATAPLAVAAFLLAHALYKAPLFFVAGNLDHGTGTRVIDRLGGLRFQMPFTAAAALLAGLAMAGLPLSFGFVAKAVIGEAKSEAELVAWVSYASLLVSAVAVAVAAVAAVRIFWHHPGANETCEAHEGGAGMVVPPLLVAGTGIVLGLAPRLIEGLLNAAARAMAPAIGGPPSDFSLGVGAVSGPAVATLAIGIAIFRYWDQLHGTLERGWTLVDRYGAAELYGRLAGGVPVVAARLTRALQHGRLSRYGAVLVGAVTLPLLALVAVGLDRLTWPADPPPGLAAAGAAAIIVTGALLACGLRDRLVLLLASGLVGYGSAALFLFTGAPDLAFTQFAVETVFVVVAASLLLVLRRLGRVRVLAEPAFRPGAATLAVGFGTLVTTLLLAASSVALDPTLTRFFGERSVPDAHGRNVVNVIIVDFRALDTLGEIGVVAFSLLAALPLLGALRGAGPDRGSP